MWLSGLLFLDGPWWAYAERTENKHAKRNEKENKWDH